MRRIAATVAIVASSAAVIGNSGSSELFGVISTVTIVNAVRGGDDESFTAARISKFPASFGTVQVNEPLFAKPVAIGVHCPLSSLPYSSVTLSGFMPSLAFHSMICTD